MTLLPGPVDGDGSGGDWTVTMDVEGMRVLDHSSPRADLVVSEIMAGRCTLTHVRRVLILDAPPALS